MDVLVPVLITFAFVSYIGVKLYQQRVLKQKKEEYEALLKEARATRFKYIHAMQNTMDAIKERERREEDLTSLKAELLGYSQEFRALLLNIRAQISKSTDSDLDKRTIDQMKLEFSGKWANADSRKKEFLELKANHAAQNIEVQRLEREEREINEIWMYQKEQVIGRYSELKDRLPLADPKKYFS
jgi:hypothetical protein